MYVYVHVCLHTTPRVRAHNDRPRPPTHNVAHPRHCLLPFLPFGTDTPPSREPTPQLVSKVTSKLKATEAQLLALLERQRKRVEASRKRVKRSRPRKRAGGNDGTPGGLSRTRSAATVRTLGRNRTRGQRGARGGESSGASDEDGKSGVHSVTSSVAKARTLSKSPWR